MALRTSSSGTLVGDRPRRVYLLAGAVLDGLGHVLERRRIVVEGNRIIAVEPTLAAPRGRHSAVLDLREHVVLPGLVDTHVHLAGGDYFPDYEDEPLAVAALRTAEAARRTLMAGITTVRTAGSRAYLDVDIRDAIRRGITVGPRILASGRGLTITGGHLAGICVEVDGPDAVRSAVRDHIKRGVDAIKIMMSAGVATSGRDIQASAFTLEEARVAVYEAHAAGRRVLTHAIGADAIRVAVDVEVDSVDHGHFLDEELAVRMRQRGIYLVPTLSPGHYYVYERKAELWRIERAEQVQQEHVKSFRLALDLGVPIAMGCDCGAPSRMPNGANALELRLMVEAGMGPEHAIRCATSESARLLGLSDMIGSVQEGMIADLIAIRGDPLSDIGLLQSSVCFVMQDGVVMRHDDSVLPEYGSRVAAPERRSHRRDTSTRWVEGPHLATATARWEASSLEPA